MVIFECAGKQALYGRYEFVQKSGEELGLLFSDGDRNFKINAFTFGYNRVIRSFSILQLTAGAQLTINFSPKELESLHGNIRVGGQ